MCFKFKNLATDPIRKITSFYRCCLSDSRFSSRILWNIVKKLVCTALHCPILTVLADTILSTLKEGFVVVKSDCAIRNLMKTEILILKSENWIDLQIGHYEYCLPWNRSDFSNWKGSLYLFIYTAWAWKKLSIVGDCFYFYCRRAILSCR